MTRKLALLSFAGLAVASVAQAQTISVIRLNDGLFRYAESGLTSTFNRTGTGGGTGNTFGFIGTNTASTSTSVASNYMFQNWWWYRSAGDTREFALSNQTLGAISAFGNSADIRYNEPIGGSTVDRLQFDFTYTLTQISPTQAAVTINWSITNLSQTEQSVAFFAYADADVLGSGGNDATYTQTGIANYFRVNASTSNSTQFFSMAADQRLNDRWQITPFSTLRTNLSNTLVNNLANTDASTGAGDFTGAFQWDLVIGAGQQVGGRVTKGYNVLVPTPGAAALLGLGALAVARRRRA